MPTPSYGWHLGAATSRVAVIVHARRPRSGSPYVARHRCLRRAASCGAVCVGWIVFSPRFIILRRTAGLPRICAHMTSFAARSFTQTRTPHRARTASARLSCRGILRHHTCCTTHSSLCGMCPAAVPLFSRCPQHRDMFTCACCLPAQHRLIFVHLLCPLVSHLHSPALPHLHAGTPLHRSA